MRRFLFAGRDRWVYLFQYQQHSKYLLAYLFARRSSREYQLDWIFTNGGNVSVSVSVGSCSNSQGLEFGIIENCQCSKPIACYSNPCVPPGGTATINANLAKCVEYYLWIDGCNGDVCDFTINTTGCFT